MSVLSTHGPAPNVSIHFTHLRSEELQDLDFDFGPFDTTLRRYELAKPEEVSKDDGQELFQSFMDNILLQLDAPGYPDPLFKRVHAILCKSSNDPKSINLMFRKYSWASRSRALNFCIQRLDDIEQTIEALRKERDAVITEFNKGQHNFVTAMKLKNAIGQRLNECACSMLVYEKCLSEAEKQFATAMETNYDRPDLILLEPEAPSPQAPAPSANPAPSTEKPATGTMSSSSSKPVKKPATAVTYSRSKPGEPATGATFSSPKPSEKPDRTGTPTLKKLPLVAAATTSPSYKRGPACTPSHHKPTGNGTLAGDDSCGSKRRAVDDSVPVAPPAKKVRVEPAPISRHEGLDDEESGNEELVDEMGDERMNNKNFGGEEGEADRNNVGDKHNKAGNLVTTVAEFDSGPKPLNYEVNRTTSDGHRFGSALDCDIVALRLEFNTLSADVNMKLAILRDIQALEEQRTGRPFGEYDSPHVPEVYNYPEVRRRIK